MRFMKDPDGNGSPETAISSTVVAALREIVGGNRVLDDPVSLRTYGVDRTTLWSPAPSLVVLPGTTAEVQAIVRLANRHGIPIVPSGGRTGLSGGAVAEKGELVVAMDRMNRILDFSPIDRTVTVEAGVVTQRLQDFAREQGLYYPVDFAAAGSSQIGGNIATNAGGIKVIRYGMTRDWVAGLKVVDGNGNVLELNRGLVKNNSGLDFRHLFIGSEGTLGIITEATLGLARAPAERSVMVLGVADLAGILEVLHAFDGVIELSAFEFFSHNGLLKVLSHGGLAPPFQGEAPYYALLEFEHRARGARNGAVRTVCSGEMGQRRRAESEPGAGAQSLAPARGHVGDARPLEALQERSVRPCVADAGVSPPRGGAGRGRVSRFRTRLVRSHRRRQSASEYPQAG